MSEVFSPKLSVQEYLIEKDAHKLSTELGEFVCLDFAGSLHLIPLNKIGTTEFEQVRFARKGCRIRITFATPPTVDQLVSSVQPEIVKAELVSRLPEVYDVTVRTYFPDKIQAKIGEDGTVVNSKRVQ